MFNSSDIEFTLINGVRVVKFINNKKKNSVSVKSFAKVKSILQEDLLNDEIVVTIVTGTGEYFTSGLRLDVDDSPDVKILEEGVDAFINYPKLLIAVVNGPAIGFGTCFLPLFDIVYASERSTFKTPFLDLGFSPDICVSYTFPRLMGKSLAWEVLLLGRSLTAREALQARLVSKLFAPEEMDTIMNKLLTYGNLPLNVVKTYKQLINKWFINDLMQANKLEMEALYKCFLNGAYEDASKKLKNRSKL